MRASPPRLPLVRALTLAALLAAGGCGTAGPVPPTPAPDVAGRGPDISYHLLVTPGDTTGYAVEMRVRNVPDTFTLAWARHPEYDSRMWRYVEDMQIGSKAGSAGIERVPCVPQNRCESARWTARAPGGEATLRWRMRVPAESRPRASWRPFISSTGALVGGLDAFPYIIGAEHAPAYVTLSLPDGWRAATALHTTDSPDRWRADNVAQLAESPILVGLLREWRFDVRGTPHRVAYWPKPGAAAFDTAAFVGSIARFATQADSLFGAMPYRQFTFLFQDDAYGGLEHPSSVTLGAPSDELAKNPRATLDETAHEFVHTWNLMAVRPAEYRGVTWRAVEPVPTLWWFEGLTMFYADALRRRAGMADTSETRVRHLERLIEGYLANPAYTRFSPESISRVSYNAAHDALGDHDASVHTVGEAVGTALDLMLRGSNEGRGSVDDVMRLLYRRSILSRAGITTADVEQAVSESCSCDARPWFDAHVRGSQPIDWARWLARVGMAMEVKWAPQLRQDGRPAADNRLVAWPWVDGGPVRLQLQTPDGVWGRAGLHTGDVLRSINGVAITTWPEFRRVVGPLVVGDSVRVDVGEGAAARTVRFVMAGYERPAVTIRPREGATAVERERRVRWEAGW